MGTEKEQERAASGEMPASRRQALARLGLTVAAAYAAPTVLHLDRSAKAGIQPSCQNPPSGPTDPSCNPFPFDGPQSPGGEPAPAE